MKTRRRQKNHLLSPPRELVTREGRFFRLCHRCLFLNESSEDIKTCTRCERPFAEDKAKDPNGRPSELAESNGSSKWSEGDWPGEEWDEPLAPEEEAWLQSDDPAGSDIQEAQEEEDMEEEGHPKRRLRGLNGLSVRW